MKDIISKRRKELGLTQKDLADKLFISDKVISKWETGKSVPDTAILVDLAKALDLSLDELLNVYDKKQEDNNDSIALMMKAKYNNISIIAFSIELISTIMFLTGNMLFENINNGRTDMNSTPYIVILLAIVFFVLSVAYFAVAANGIKGKYARFIKLCNIYFNSFVIIFAIFINLDALCVVYYNGFSGGELFLLSLIVTLIVASLAALIIWIRILINKRLKIIK